MSTANDELSALSSSPSAICSSEQEHEAYNDESTKLENKCSTKSNSTLLYGANTTLDNLQTTNSGDAIIEREANINDGDGVIAGVGISNSGLSISLMQSSPPPHSYRHSRAYRHFKNPPQPHMCIRTTTETGEELFINVLSWTRIVIPQEPSDPIPLYGGMRVPPGSPRSPPIVFAVMANPEVLKDSGRHSKDPEERRAMVELMCDFVEAMNPGVKLVRNAVILKDRDISGELKDVWNAVQAQRDREREEQMIQQRQQQHYHNSTTLQMFPKSPETTPTVEHTMDDEKLLSAGDTVSVLKSDDRNDDFTAISISRAAICEQTGVVQDGEKSNLNSNINAESNITNTIESDDQIDSNAVDSENSNDIQSAIENQKQINNQKKSNSSSITTLTNEITPVGTVATITVTTPSKKEKLGGFLPNGCIFPRFKNSKHKDKEKETKAKDKEKTLLNALKKSKDKKVQPIEHTEKVSLDSDMKSQYDKNCINLESEVQKLDLNKLDSVVSNDSNIFIKVKVAASPNASK